MCGTSAPVSVLAKPTLKPYSGPLNQDSKNEWECQSCSLINSWSNKHCEVCGAPAGSCSSELLEADVEVVNSSQHLLESMFSFEAPVEEGSSGKGGRM